jgi:predicted acylesterase/phospholipase RssA
MQMRRVAVIEDDTAIASAVAARLRAEGFDVEAVADGADALAAARASCAIPLVAGAAPTYRGEPMVDGGLLEPIPFRSALREGASHVLVLRSRPGDWRSRPHRRAAELPLARAHPQLAPIFRACDRRYNAAADALEAYAQRAGAPVVRQVTVASDARLVGRFSTDAAHIADSVRLGAAAMIAALGGDQPALRLPDPPAPQRVPAWIPRAVTAAAGRRASLRRTG